MAAPPGNDMDMALWAKTGATEVRRVILVPPARSSLRCMRERWSSEACEGCHCQPLPANVGQFVEGRDKLTVLGVHRVRDESQCDRVPESSPDGPPADLVVLPFFELARIARCHQHPSAPSRLGHGHAPPTSLGALAGSTRLSQVPTRLVCEEDCSATPIGRRPPGRPSLRSAEDQGATRVNHPRSTPRNLGAPQRGGTARYTTKPHSAVG